MYWVDDHGELREGDEEDARRYGYREATEEDLRAHNEKFAIAEADTKGPLGLIGEGFERGLAHIQDLGHQGFTPPPVGSDAFGPGGGALPSFGGTPLPKAPAPEPGAVTFPEATSEEARLRTKAHPVYEGIGTGLATAPLAAIGGAAGGALGAAGTVAGTVGAIGTEALVEAVAQEYDDAWLEQRPVELKNVAAYTAMFALGDVVLRGAAHGAGKLLDKLSPAPTVGARNIIAEAQAGAEKASTLRPAQSVGAASARDMAEPFDEALSTMTDRDAMVLARDADDHYHLVARDAADELTRIHRGLTESLGNQLKYEDFKIGADAWTEKILDRQSQWLEDVAAEGQAVINRIRGDAIDYGNAGKLVAKDIENYTDLLMNEADGAQRNYLADQFKKKLDRRIMDIAADWKGDAHARKELLKILEPYAGSATERGMLRDGLENPKYWGHNAEIQKALNAPWHDLLTHWTKFQEKLYEASGEVKFGEMGAGRKVMESTAERVLSVLQKDPRVLQDIGRHVAGTFDGYQRLIEARQAKGIVGQDALPGLSDSIRNLMEDWNLGATLGVAKARAENAAKNPRNWHLKALELAEKAPFGVGTVVGAARTAGKLAGDLHIKPGTPLADVWDMALKRYAQNPALADPSINQAYSDWMQAALRQRGAPIPDRRTAWGGIKDAAGKAAKEHGGKVAGGLFGLGAEAALTEPQLDENGQPVAQAGGGGALAGAALAALLGKGGRRLLKEEAAPLIGVLARQEGKDDWTHGWVRSRLKGTAPVGIRDIESALAPVTYDAATRLYTKAENAERPELRAFVDEAMKRTGASEDDVVRTLLMEGTGYKPRGPQPKRTPKPKAPVGPAPAVEDRTGIVGDFDDMGDELLTPPDMKEGLAAVRAEWSKGDKASVRAYQSALGYRMNEALRTGNFDRAGADRAGDVVAALQGAIDSGATAPGFVRRGVELTPAEVEQLTKAKILTAKAFVSTSPNPQLAKRFAGAGKDTRIEGLGMRRPTGDVPVLFEIEQATGVPLSAGEVTLRPGTQFKVLGHRIEKAGTKDAPKILHVFRVRESGYKPGAPTDGIIAGGLIGLGAMAAAGNASAAPPDAPEAPDLGPTAPPGVLYREALRSVANGAPLIIQKHASAALRKRPPVGRDPLRAFVGRRGLDAAVDAAREAVTTLQGNPEALIDELGGSTGELARTHPSLYMALVEKASSLVAYLAANVPERTGKTLLDPEGMPPSRDRSVDFVYKVVGATRPRQAMGDIARLEAPPEEVASFQQNWPELWEPMRLELLGQIQRRYEAGRPVDSERLRQLDGLLGMDGQLDPSASAAVAQQIIDSASAAPAAPAGNSAPSGAPSPSGRASGMLQTRLAGLQMESTSG